MKIEGNENPSAGGELVASPRPSVSPKDRASLAGSTPSALVHGELSVDSNTPFHSVGFTVSSIGYAVGRRFRETLAPLALEPREFALLRAVGAAEGQSQQCIGERLQIPASRMVAFVDALEGRSLLERRHNPRDRRTRELHLTRAGRELLERAFTLAAGLERDICAELTSDERAQLLERLQRVGGEVGLAPGVHAAHAHAALAEE